MDAVEQVGAGVTASVEPWPAETFAIKLSTAIASGQLLALALAQGQTGIGFAAGEGNS